MTTTIKRKGGRFFVCLTDATRLTPGWLRACLRLNPRILFAVGVIGVSCFPPRQISARPTADTISARQAPNDSFLRAVALIESSNKADAIGDGGKARGLYQMHLAAVQDCGGTKADWLNLTNKAVADKFASIHLARIDSQLKREAVPINDATRYMVWNLGFNGAKRRGFELAKCPDITRRAIHKMKGLK
jgi:hypothetical protein